MRSRSIKPHGFRLLVAAALLLSAGCADPVRDNRLSYLAEVDALERMRESRKELITSLPEDAQKELEQLAERTAEARRRYFTAVETKNDAERKAATADEQAGNIAYDETLDRLLLEHVPAFKKLREEIAVQQARVDELKAVYDPVKR